MTQLAAQLRYLNRLERFAAIKPGLDAMRALLAALGNPHEQFPSIHIAGTNGKGSVAAILSSLLQHRRLQTTNYKLQTHNIGRYTSPHLTRFNERVCINDSPITDIELARLISDVRRAARRRHLSPTFFEFTTAVALLHFARQHVDLAVIEVGMGGRLDATNVITPLVSIITNIGLDHTAWLGPTRRTIAREKAGIIKPGVPLITAARDPVILNYFKKSCRELRAPFYPVHRHLRARRLRHDLSGQTFAVSGAMRSTFTLPLLGRHQIDNALTALLAFTVLSSRRENLKSPLPKWGEGRVRGYQAKNASHTKLLPITPTDIVSSLAAIRWPGRLQIFSRDPFILLDGAHNPDGVRALSRFLDEEKEKLPPPDVLLLGSKNDKDISALLKLIVPRFRRVIVSEASYQPLPAAELAARLVRKTPGAKTITAEPNLPRALTLARRDLRPGGMLLVTGSLYLIGDTLKLLFNRQPTRTNDLASQMSRRNLIDRQRT